MLYEVITVTIKEGVLDLKMKMNFDHVDLESVAGNIAITNDKIKAIYLDTIKQVKDLALDIDYKNNGELFKFRITSYNVCYTKLLRKYI